MALRRCKVSEGKKYLIFDETLFLSDLQKSKEFDTKKPNKEDYFRECVITKVYQKDINTWGAEAIILHSMEKIDCEDGWFQLKDEIKISIKYRFNILWAELFIRILKLLFHIIWFFIQILTFIPMLFNFKSFNILLDSIRLDIESVVSSEGNWYDRAGDRAGN